MDRTPVFVGQRDDGGALDAGKHLYYVVDLRLGGVHHDIFLVCGRLYSLKTEQHLVEHLALLIAQVAVGYEQSLALHDNLNLAQVVAYEGAA